MRCAGSLRVGQLGGAEAVSVVDSRVRWLWVVICRASHGSASRHAWVLYRRGRRAG
jgi:hypothetical protein